MAVPGWGCWWWDSNPQGLAPVGIADATLPLVRRGPMEKWSGEVSPDHVPRYTCGVPARSSGSEELLNPRVRALGHQRPGPTSHRHLPLPRVAVGRNLLDRVVALHRLPAHQRFSFPGPRVACEVAVCEVAAHARVVDAVIRVALALGAVTQDP